MFKLILCQLFHDRDLRAKNIISIITSLRSARWGSSNIHVGTFHVGINEQCLKNKRRLFSHSKGITSIEASPNLWG